MAVIDGLPEIEVSIRINGSEDACIEYDDPDPPEVSAAVGSATHATSKVIESQIDATFSIHYKIQNRPDWVNDDDVLAVYLFLDGNPITGHVGKPAMINETIVSAIDCFWRQSTTPGKEIRKQFKFTPVRIVESGNERFVADQSITKHLGVIEVDVYRAKVQNIVAWVPTSTDLKNSREISETALKGRSLSHSTSFTEGAETDARTGRVSLNIRDGAMCVARFFFRYKPKTSLQIDGLIPRDPSPEHSPEPSPPSPPQTVANLPLADIMRLAQERLEQLGPQVKTEPGISAKREADEETDSRPRKIYKVDADGTIDLSDD
ncbi:hypothetical protein CNYM01_04954 [Colletotrichum nymphaeae SA-01]|uniref:DUF7918 domain-containing protein n=1 Tax=Colletotrichum nymphaeae SA-01 TaxID=1460502 RepID=A0A135T024_9PEZI|nr:hypothetical protein CNYM01_04954 [Colletotrichum nymphaeae SA-01]